MELKCRSEFDAKTASFITDANEALMHADARVDRLSPEVSDLASRFDQKTVRGAATGGGRG